MTVNGIKAENTELRQEVARLDEALALEVRRSADLASEKADDRVQYSKLRDVCRAQEEAITRLTAENEKLRAALEGVLKAYVYNDACECMSCERARAALAAWPGAFPYTYHDDKSVSLILPLPRRPRT